MVVGIVIGSGVFFKAEKILVATGGDLPLGILGWIIGGVNFSELKISLPTVEVAGEKLPAATINYGNFLQTCLDFFIVAFCIFMLIKLVNKFAKKKEEEPKPEPKPTAEEKLLTEIRDLLKNK